MSFGYSPPKIEIPRNHFTTTIPDARFGRHRESLWSRFNHAITKLGNWFADHVDGVTDAIHTVLVLCYLALVIAAFVRGWSHDGFWMGLGSGLLSCFVGLLALGLVSYVVQIAVNIVMYAFRIVFWNGWTLLFTTIIVSVLTVLLST